MRCKLWIVIIILLGLLSVKPLFADENDASSKPAELEQITVSARKNMTIIKDVVPEETIKIPLVSGSVLDALANEAGVQLKRSTLSGTDGSKLRLRGFDETRLKITKDGVTLNNDGSYGNGPVDWSIFSPENVKSIEIYRGAGPAKFGNTLGGVVNIVTLKPTEIPNTVIKSTYGSFDTWDTSISHTWKVGPVGWALSAGHFESDGYLRNNTLDRDNFSALLTYDFPGNWQVGAGLDYSLKDNGMAVYNRPDSPYYDSSEPDADESGIGGPGIGARLINGSQAWGDGSSVEDENINLTSFVEKKTDKGSARIDFRLWNQDRTETFVDAADPSKTIYERETEAEDNNWSIQAQADYELKNHLIEVGGETRKYGWGAQDVTFIDESYFNGSINFFKFITDGFEDQNGIMSYQALYAQDTWAVTPSISLELGLRTEWFKADSVDPEAFGFDWDTDVSDMDETNLDPRLAVTYRPWESGSICARFGMTHRYPTSPEYFWWYLNNSTDYFNTDFKPEAARQYELSYVQSVMDTLSFVVRGYYYDIDDYISSTSVPGVGSVYFNIGQVNIRGLELGFSAQLPYGFRFWANVTTQKGDKDDDPWDEGNELSRELADFPETLFNAGIDYRYNEKIRARLWMNHVGSRDHLSSGTRVEMDSYTLILASASYRVWDTDQFKLDLELTGENLLDEDYQEEEGYPLPGVSVMGGVRVQF